jgi:hypothetical protein
METSMDDDNDVNELICHLWCIKNFLDGFPTFSISTDYAIRKVQENQVGLKLTL